MARSPQRLQRVLGGALLGAAALTASTGPAQAVGTPWQVSGRLSLGQAASISCASAGSCWAIAGGQLLQSDTNGASWIDRSSRVPASVDVLDALDCPAVGSCYVAGRQPDQTVVVLRLTPTGDIVVPVATAQRLLSISCLSGARCLAADGSSAYATTDGGASWTPLSPPTELRPRALSCVARSSTCFAVGGGNQDPRVARTDNAGRSWHLQADPYETVPWADVSCPTVNDCIAVGEQSFDEGTVVVTHDGGASWNFAPLPAGTGPLYFVSCGGPSSCEVSGGPGGSGFGTPYALGSTDGGATWSRQNLGQSPSGASAGSPALACTSATTCAAVTRSGLGFTTTDGGANWTAVRVPAALSSINRMACPSRTLCFALATDSLIRREALRSTDGGATWSAQVLRLSGGYPVNLDCPSITTCFALIVTSTFDGQRTTVVGHLLTTTNGGVTWRVTSSPDVGSLRGLSCPTTTTCVGYGEVHKQLIVLVSTDGGATWQPRPVPDGVSSLAAISCGSAATCVLTGTPDGASYPTRVEVTTDQAMTYTAVDPSLRATGYSIVQCIGATCYAVSRDAHYHGIVLVSVDSGLHWVDRPVPLSATRLQLISCSSARTCAIGANNGNGDGNGAELLGTTDGGTHWRIHRLPMTAASFPGAIACGGSTCLASDYGYSGTPRIMTGAP